MKKKKQSAQPSAATETSDLKSLIHDHSLFFDKLVELIPAKFYITNDDARPWFQGLSKSAKASAKRQTKENIKKARRDRLDPDKSNTTTLELLKQSIEGEKDEDEEDEDGDETTPIVKLSKSVTYEELRQRLRRRIDELRGNRGNVDKPRNEKREQRDIERKKRKYGAEAVEKRISEKEKSKGEIEKVVTEASKGIEFGKVKLGDEDEIGRKKRKIESKEKVLEKAKKLQEAKKDPEKGETMAKKHSWKAATSRAMGVKVHDDPKLLKKSIKKEKKQHVKNVDKWKDRINTTVKLKEAKQQKRTDNLAERANQKKARKIAKREKKLMRPGFEGRKEGYINVE